MKKALVAIEELRRKKLIDHYAVGGGIAALFYIEPFLTYDLDVFVILSPSEKAENIISLSPIFDFLTKKGYFFKGEHIIIEGTPVQFIAADELEAEAVEAAREIEYEKIKIRVIAPEYLLAILLRSGRPKDRDKVGKLMAQTKISRDKLAKILTKYGLKGKFKF